ncbi:MAG: hypothetical protein C0507_15755 [Cyanobacteria bacterium PR.3.49]|nr:hypothetical protein [Cyanobacteria bacterium PR.3.49]
MLNTALPPGFVPRSTALVNTFACTKPSNSLVKRHLHKNTFTTIQGVDIRALALAKGAETEEGDATEGKSAFFSIKQAFERMAGGMVESLNAKSVKTSAVAIDNLIDSVSDYYESTDSKQVAEDAAWFVEPFAEKWNQTINLNCERLTVEASEDRIKRILINLLSNAIQFSPEGSRIDLTVSAVNGFAVFSVKDEGPGIPAEKLESIFEAQNRHSKKVTGEVLGTGLGLSICKELVEAEGGQIGVGSGPFGSYFWFTVPMQ